MEISLNNITVKYKGATRESLDGVSFSIKKGTKHGIFGANGAGKSTMMKVICNVIQPTTGKVTYTDNGNAVLNSKSIKQKLGYVPQDFAFYEDLNVIQNAIYFGTMFNLSEHTIRERVNDLLLKFGLEQHKLKKIKNFSGGMKRKVNLILGILHQPEILVLDEPTVGIDVYSKYDILNYLNEMHATGCTIIYTSHQMNESQSFCSNFTLLDKGKNVVTGNLEEILEHQNADNLESILLQTK